MCQLEECKSICIYELDDFSTKVYIHYDRCYTPIWIEYVSAVSADIRVSPPNGSFKEIKPSADIIKDNLGKKAVGRQKKTVGRQK